MARKPAIPPGIPSQQLDPALAAAIQERHRRVLDQPGSGDAWGRLGQTFDAAEFAEEARQCYAEALVHEPGSVRWHHLLGLRLLRSDPANGIRNLELAIQGSGSNGFASRLRLAQAWMEMGKLAEATTQLNQMLAREPNHAAARVELARAQLALGRPDGIPLLLVPCLTNGYTARPAHQILAQAHLRLGDPGKSAEHAKWATTLPKPFDWPDPFLKEVQEIRRDSRRLAEQANHLLSLGRQAEAESVVTQLLDHYPEDIEGLMLLGRIRLQQRRCLEAETLLMRVVGHRPDSAISWAQLGMARYCQSRWLEASTAFERAINLKPDFGPAHFNLGMSRGRLGQHEASIASLREALRYAPGDAATYVAMAEEFLRAEKHLDARDHATKALSLEPNNPKARAVLDRLKNSLPIP